MHLLTVTISENSHSVGNSRGCPQRAKPARCFSVENGPQAQGHAQTVTADSFTMSLSTCIEDNSSVLVVGFLMVPGP